MRSSVRKKELLAHEESRPRKATDRRKTGVRKGGRWRQDGLPLKGTLAEHERPVILDVRGRKGREKPVEKSLWRKHFIGKNLSGGGNVAADSAGERTGKEGSRVAHAKGGKA